jgi:hypothetical protein
VNNNSGPFETIHSAHEFMTLLEGVIYDTTSRLEAQLPGSESSRSGDGLRLAIYKLQQLRDHIQKSGRILNDLQMIERVLMSNEVGR